MLKDAKFRSGFKSLRADSKKPLATALKSVPSQQHLINKNVAQSFDWF